MDNNTGGGRGWGRRGREANNREMISINSRHQKKNLINIFRVNTNKIFNVLTAKTLKQPKCPLIGEQKNKLWHIHTMGYYSAIKRNELSSHEKTCRNIKCILLSEILKY